MKMPKKKTEKNDWLSKIEQLLMEQQFKVQQWIELASNTITIVTGQEDNNNDREDNKDVEEHNKAEEAFEDGPNRTMWCE